MIVPKNLDPSSKNWFVLFYDEFQKSVLKNRHLLDTYVFSYKKTTDFAHFYLHFSGLFYGTADNRLLCDFEASESWNVADHFKISLTEGLFLTYLHHQGKQSFDEDIATIVTDCIKKIYDFYVLFTMNDTMAKKYRTLYNKGQEVAETVEQVIDSRVSNPTMLKRDFWRGSQFNIFSGMDVLYFASWLQLEYAYDRRDCIKKEIISVMNRSAVVDALENKNAQAIVSYFITSGNFSSDDTLQLDAYSDFDAQICREETPYIYRLLLYEYASYICLCDSVYSVKKVIFLRNFGQELELKEDDMQQSLITVENFLMNKGDAIFYLHYGEGIDIVRKAFINRCQDFIQKNKKKIVTEILESKELVELLRKSVTEELSDEEKQKVKEQIFDLVKTIPSLAIFMLPGAVVILPILMKILPEEIFMPSSFVNKKK